MSSVSSADKVSKEIFDEKHMVNDRVDDALSEIDHGIVKDWDEEESAVTRKYVLQPVEHEYLTDTSFLKK
jgi:hypothetical protein